MQALDVAAMLTPSALGSVRGLSRMSQTLIGSEILKIADEIRALQAQGASILNLTVGDFNSHEFPIPAELRAGVEQAYATGHTNYPPSSGILSLRNAVRDLYKRHLHLNYPVESILITSGARPAIACAFLALLDPGETVVYAVPSWNNNHYAAIVGAQKAEIVGHADAKFFPTAQELKPHLSAARLLCINSPLNPTGTVIDEANLRALCTQVLEENKRRQAQQQKPLYILYDQVYWMLTFQGVRHVNPVGLVPELAPFTIYVDGISKAFAATGLRVGWAVGPGDIIRKMAALSTHVGAWAPLPEQVAAEKFLNNDEAMMTFVDAMRAKLYRRLDALRAAIIGLKNKKLPVDCIAPEAGLYLSLRFDVKNTRIKTDEELRKYLLESAGIALVPFQAFGLNQDSGWFRASVGAVTEQECQNIGARLEKSLRALQA